MRRLSTFAGVVSAALGRPCPVAYRVQQTLHLPHSIRMLCGDVFRFTQVLLEVVKLQRARLAGFGIRVGEDSWDPCRPR